MVNKLNTDETKVTSLITGYQAAVENNPYMQPSPHYYIANKKSSTHSLHNKTVRYEAPKVIKTQTDNTYIFDRISKIQQFNSHDKKRYLQGNRLPSLTPGVNSVSAIHPQHQQPEFINLAGMKAFKNQVLTFRSAEGSTERSEPPQQHWVTSLNHQNSTLSTIKKMPDQFYQVGS